MKKLFFTIPFFVTTLFSSELLQMQKACDNKMPTACYEFGLLYEKGMGVTQDKTKAKSYYLQACEYGFDKACQKFETIQVKNT